MLGKGEGAEEKRGVDGVTGECVAKQRQARDVAGGETCGCVWVRAEELPGSEVGDEEELERPEKNGATDAENTAAIGEQCADEHAEEEAGVDHGDQAMNTDEQVASEE